MLSHGSFAGCLSILFSAVVFADCLSIFPTLASRLYGRLLPAVRCFALYDAANNAPVFNFPHSTLLRQVRSFSRRAFRAALRRLQTFNKIFFLYFLYEGCLPVLSVTEREEPFNQNNNKFYGNSARRHLQPVFHIFFIFYTTPLLSCQNLFRQRLWPASE